MNVNNKSSDYSMSCGWSYLCAGSGDPLVLDKGDAASFLSYFFMVLGDEAHVSYIRCLI